MTDPVKLHFYACLAMLGFCVFVIATGRTPDSGHTETAPLSVRENPASYKPIYSSTTGWIPIPVAGGGYSSGK